MSYTGGAGFLGGWTGGYRRVGLADSYLGTPPDVELYSRLAAYGNGPYDIQLNGTGNCRLNSWLRCNQTFCPYYDRYNGNRGRRGYGYGGGGGGCCGGSGYGYGGSYYYNY